MFPICGYFSTTRCPVLFLVHPGSAEHLSIAQKSSIMSSIRVEPAFYYTKYSYKGICTWIVGGGWNLHTGWNPSPPKIKEYEGGLVNKSHHSMKWISLILALLGKCQRQVLLDSVCWQMWKCSWNTAKLGFSSDGVIRTERGPLC